MLGNCDTTGLTQLTGQTQPAVGSRAATSKLLLREDQNAIADNCKGTESGDEIKSPVEIKD